MSDTEKRLWMTTVVVDWKPRTDTPGGWWAQATFTCGVFCKPGLIDGQIRTRYPTGLRNAVDQIMALAEQLGIEVAENMDMGLYAEGDGDDPEVRLPLGWKNKIRREAARRGWESYSEENEHEHERTENEQP